MAHETADAYDTPEGRARREIDRKVTAAGWVVQSYRDINLGAARGVAVREVPLTKGSGRADYMLFVDREAVGAIEAKPDGTPLAGVEGQSRRYVEGVPDTIPAVASPLPFAYESTGNETWFTNLLEEEPASRRVFWFHRPETLGRWAQKGVGNGADATLRRRLGRLPELDPKGLWPAQAQAVRNLEDSLAKLRARALIQMATGSGKTFTAANIAYRLVKHGGAERVLFLVDRANLGRQTLSEFQRFTTPDDGRKFTELYNVQHLTSNTIDPVARVVITTIQRLYALLRGEELDEETDEYSSFETEPAAPVTVDYNPDIPIEMFDVVVVDECHRSIYGVWRQVLDYFDAFMVGLTATPGKQTFGFFDGNLVMEYGHEQAVADSVNVDFDVYRIRTEISEQGSQVDAGLVTKFRDRETRAERLDKLDEDFLYDEKTLDRTVVAKDQIRTIVRTFKEKLPEIFPNREWVPKTLVFAKNDAHADDIVRIVREEFGKGNDFAAKITYKSGERGKSAEQLLQDFRNSPMPRIAVTVDMIATGTDVRPIECVFFMRMVKSRNYFEQMKGRGVRTIGPDDLRNVTPDALGKDRFVIIDAVGVTESDLSDTQPLERKPTVAFETLLQQVAMGDRTEETVSSLASRLARLNMRLTQDDRAALETTAGVPIGDLAHGIVQALDPQLQLDQAVAAAGAAEPPPEAISEVTVRMLDTALRPITDNPDLRKKLVDVRRSYEQLIDEFSKDTVIDAEYSKEATDRAKTTVESFRAYIEEHRDEIDALRILYQHPYPARLTFKQVKELADAIALPPRRWTPDRLWEAYETLDKSKVRGSPGRVLTDLVSLVRYTLDQDGQLVAYPELVSERFAAWLKTQEQAGRTFTPEQMTWLEQIRDTIATSLGVVPDDFEYAPFNQHGGLGKGYELFGDDLNALLDELNQELVA
ncbi:MAG: type I restriction-modification enzyme R subunit C-terminal domain-containing protein [Acidimicrobiia bacterium]